MPRKQSYSKYRKAFGLSIVEIKNMPRLEFCKCFGTKFRYMTNSKFMKTIKKIACAYEEGDKMLRSME